jgi:hypothetical protein
VDIYLTSFLAATPAVADSLVTDWLRDSNSLFGAIMAPCTIFAVFGIAFQLYFIVPSFAQLEEFPANASKLFWAAVLVAFIVGRGTLARDFALFNWAAISSINTAIDNNIEQVSNLIQLKKDFTGETGALNAIETKTKQCLKIAPTLANGSPNPAFNACQGELSAQITADTSAGRIKNPTTLDNMGAAVGNLASGDFGQATSDIFKGIGGQLTNLIDASLKGIFGGWRMVISNFAQVSIFAAILALPIPLCLSVINISPLMVWFSSFWAVGIFQFNLTILTRTFEYLNVKMGANISVYFIDIAICLFAPAIAGLLARGGGIAIFNATLNLAGEAVKLVPQVAGVALKFTPVGRFL